MELANDHWNDESIESELMVPSRHGRRTYIAVSERSPSVSHVWVVCDRDWKGNQSVRVFRFVDGVKGGEIGFTGENATRDAMNVLRLIFPITLHVLCDSVHAF